MRLRDLFYALPLCLLAACVSPPEDTPSGGRYIVDLERAPDEVIQLWPDDADGAAQVSFSEQIIERENSYGLRDRAALTVTNPTLSVFRAEKPNGHSILIIPGGGYARVVIDKEGYEGARYFSRRGFDVFVLKYRLPHPDWPLGADTPLQDAQRAMILVRDHSAPGASVTAMGFSAGGHLAGSLAQRFDDPLSPSGSVNGSESIRPDLAILVYPVALTSGPFAHAGSVLRLSDAQGETDLAPHFDLTQRPNPDGPPVFLLHTLDDSSVPVENTLRLAEAYRSVSTLASLHIFKTGAHGFGFRGIDDLPVGQWPILVEAWIMGFVAER